jgi:hypothetical protein
MGAKYLALSQEPDAERWRLPDESKTEEVKTQIEGAMTEGRAVRIKVVVGDRGAGELIVNGRAIEAALVWEVGVQEPTFSIID